MPRDQFANGDWVMKGSEFGVVVERISKRTGSRYLVVSITRGPRKGQLEFPERGWVIDDGSTGGNERPSHEPDDFLGRQNWKTRGRYRG